MPMVIPGFMSTPVPMRRDWSALPGRVSPPRQTHGPGSSLESRAYALPHPLAPGDKRVSVSPTSRLHIKSRAVQVWPDNCPAQAICFAYGLLPYSSAALVDVASQRPACCQTGPSVSLCASPVSSAFGMADCSAFLFPLRPFQAGRFARLFPRLCPEKVRLLFAASSDYRRLAARLGCLTSGLPEKVRF